MRVNTRDQSCIANRFAVLVALFLSLQLFSLNLFAAFTNAAALVSRTFQEAQARYRRLPLDGQAAWQFARACFDLAEFATNSSQRIEIAEQGVAACNQLLAQKSDSGPGHYYLGMNL